MPAPLKAVGGPGEMLQDPTWRPPTMFVWDLPRTPRAIMLRAKTAFVENTQHDHKEVNWDGIPRDPGVGYLRERMRPQGFVPANAAPYGHRKPDAGVPLPCQITRSFTDMLLGRYPALRVPADADTERYLEAAINASNTWDALVEARDIAGGCGSAALSLAVEDGEPMTDTHTPADLWVREWQPGAKWVPVEVVEQRLVEVTEEVDGELKTFRVWRTKVWTQTHVINYKDVPENWGQSQDGERKPIPVDGEPVEHKAGRCPVVWYQNTRNSKSPEGDTDMKGAYHLSDRVDRLQSMVVRGSIANTDPTLVRKIEDRLRRRRPIERKGYGAMIDVGPGGDAKLLEITGTSIETSWNGVRQLRDEILQTASCVIIDPENAGAYKSGEALALLWRRMEARCNRLRVPLTSVIRQVAELWIELGAAWGITSVEEAEGQGIILPPLVTEPTDEELAMNPEAKPETGIYQVGTGRYVEIVWPPYHVPTATQLQAMAQALAVANGQKPTVSQETATGMMVSYLGKGDPTEERRKIEEERAAGQEQFAAAMFPGGGEEDREEAGKTAEAEAEAQAAGGAKQKPKAPEPEAE